MGCLLWPFTALWSLLGFILGLVGRLAAVIIGLVLVAVGVILCITVVGAVAGVPLIIFGLLLAIKAFFP